MSDALGWLVAIAYTKHPFALSLSKGFTSASKNAPFKQEGLRQAQPERIWGLHV
ncbi:hypothetical protein K9B33_11035 [Sphingobium sp. 3R8]|uniref:hypothetical protein n=1 Tax=Sphingobium sp. 3R8 TaxID=2874921 RepID=UPI001CCF970C|nr:hypothetical protein [Sphingobium sp. 3R8]MBZ9648082.1 hypothetical protein [Sphingobium sp. 3R8]